MNGAFIMLDKWCYQTQNTLAIVAGTLFSLKSDMCERMQKVNVFLVIKQASVLTSTATPTTTMKTTTTTTTATMATKKKIQHFLSRPKHHHSNFTVRTLNTVLKSIYFYVHFISRSSFLRSSACRVVCSSALLQSVFFLSFSFLSRFSYFSFHESTRHEKCVNIKCLITRIIILTSVPIVIVYSCVCVCAWEIWFYFQFVCFN